MRRRSILTAGAAAAASSALAPLSRSAAAEHAAASATQTWICPPNRYEITLRRNSVSCDCFGLDALPGAGSAGAGLLGSAENADGVNAAMVAVGPQHQPVTWEAQAWNQPDAFTLMLTLRGPPVDYLDKPSQPSRREFNIDRGVQFFVSQGVQFLMSFDRCTRRRLDRGDCRKVPIRTLSGRGLVIGCCRLSEVPDDQEADGSVVRLGAASCCHLAGGCHPGQRLFCHPHLPCISVYLLNPAE